VRDRIEKLIEAAKNTPIVTSTNMLSSTGNTVVLAPEAQILTPFINTLESSLEEYRKMDSDLRDRIEALRLDADGGELHQRMLSMSQTISVAL